MSQNGDILVLDVIKDMNGLNGAPFECSNGMRIICIESRCCELCSQN